MRETGRIWYAALVAILAAGSVATSAWAQGGTIVGEVKVAGNPPAPKAITINKDVEVCGKDKQIVDVAVSGDKGLGGAVISVADVKGWKPAGRAVLDQKGCEFQPPIVVMAPGELDILNSDGVLHNIHTFSTANSAINKAQPKFKKKMTETFGKPEIIKVQCDAHAWMHGYIVVTESPTVTTDAKGMFKLANVPAGKHKIEVWHPVLGKQSKEVEVKAGQEAKVAFELAAK